MKSKILKNKLNIILLCLITGLAFVYTCSSPTTSGGDDGTTGDDGNGGDTPDTTIPTVASSMPENNGELAIDANITLTFSEDIQAGNGTITLTTTNGGASIPISITPSPISGKVLTINPSNNLMLDAIYTLTLPAGVIKDTSNNPNENVTRMFTTPPAAKSISAGNSHSCAVAGGKAYCWGNNGQASPVAVLRGEQAAATTGETDLTNVTAISAGSAHSCAVADGKAYCWGNGSNGRLGNGATGDQTSPVAVLRGAQAAATTGETDLTNVTAISAGQNHSCAIAGGKAYCWGDGGSGRLGNGATTGDQESPIAVLAVGQMAGGTALTNVTAISASDTHSCAVAGGKAYCWGNGNGRLGNGTTNDSSSPVAVVRGEQAAATNGEANLTNVTAISAGESHSCAVAGGKAYCWGSGNGGRLGNGATGNQTSPVAVLRGAQAAATNGEVNLTNVIVITAGGRHSCAIAGGKAYCWGGGTNGKLGNDATTGNQTSPVAVLRGAQAAATTGEANLTNVIVITAGGRHSCAVASGKAYCWGSGTAAQLGNGDTTRDQASPVAVNAFP